MNYDQNKAQKADELAARPLRPGETQAYRDRLVYMFRNDISKPIQEAFVTMEQFKAYLSRFPSTHVVGYARDSFRNIIRYFIESELDNELLHIYSHVHLHVMEGKFTYEDASVVGCVVEIPFSQWAAEFQLRIDDRWRGSEVPVTAASALRVLEDIERGVPFKTHGHGWITR